MSADRRRTDDVLIQPRPTRRQLLRGALASAGAVVLAGGLGAVLEACAPSAPSAPAPSTSGSPSTSTSGGPTASAAGKAGGVLRYGNSAFPLSFDPFAGSGEATFNVTMAVHRGLLSYDLDGKVQAEVAESWEQEGNDAYRFHLRSNAKFHDGSPVTADDVKASFDRMLDAKSGAQRFGQYDPTIKSVEVVDPATVRVRLKDPNATFLQLLALCGSPVVSRASMAANPTQPLKWVGVGPFRYKSQEQGNFVELEKNPAFYRAGVPKLDGMKVIAYADDNLRVAALKAGDVDIIDFVPYPAMADLAKTSGIVLDSNDRGFGMELQYNVTKPPFDKPQVRQALGFAIDRKKMVQSAFFGYGAEMDGPPLPSDSPFFDAKLGSFFTYDPDKARSLLAQAGYPNGFSATLLANTTYAFHKDTAVAAQEDLKKIGLNIDLALPDWPTRVSLNQKGQFDFAVEGIGPYLNDPDGLSPLIVGKNTILGSYGFQDPKLDELFTQGRGTLDSDKRKAVYAQAQQLFLDDTPVLPLVWRSQAFAYRSNVRGFRQLPGAVWQNSVYALDGTTVQ